MPRGSIGECLQQAKVYLDTPDLFAWTLVIVVISLAFEKVFIAFMNEPFKGLDEKTKANVIFDTRRRCNKRTVLMVTHDKDELSAMGAVQTINL